MNRRARLLWLRLPKGLKKIASGLRERRGRSDEFCFVLKNWMKLKNSLSNDRQQLEEEIQKRTSEWIRSYSSSIWSLGPIEKRRRRFSKSIWNGKMWARETLIHNIESEKTVSLNASLLFPLHQLLPNPSNPSKWHQARQLSLRSSWLSREKISNQLEQSARMWVTQRRMSNHVETTSCSRSRSCILTTPNLLPFPLTFLLLSHLFRL